MFNRIFKAKKKHLRAGIEVFVEFFEVIA
ncbi:hypothetical protein IFVP182_P30020 [Vibrio parahaemolyticus]